MAAFLDGYADSLKNETDMGRALNDTSYWTGVEKHIADVCKRYELDEEDDARQARLEARRPTF